VANPTLKISWLSSFKARCIVSVVCFVCFLLFSQRISSHSCETLQRKRLLEPITEYLARSKTYSKLQFTLFPVWPLWLCLQFVESTSDTPNSVDPRTSRFRFVSCWSNGATEVSQLAWSRVSHYVAHYLTLSTCTLSDLGLTTSGSSYSFFCILHCLWQT